MRVAPPEIDIPFAPSGTFSMTDMLSDEIRDRLAIRQLIENWVMYRDARQWDRFRTVWHPGGKMNATWFQGSPEDFIRVSEEGFARGVRILHQLGGSTIDIVGARAIAQSKITITQRDKVEGVLCDVTMMGRTYDFIEKRAGRWGLVLRQPTYEMDRIDPVDPAAVVKLDQDLLAQFPEGYRHLAYLQTRIGYTVKRDMPGIDGPELDAVYARGAAWLRGEPL